MKLKSILIIAMVAIMAMAGGAFAATTTTNSTNTLDTPGFAGGVTNLFGCNSIQGATVACGAIAAAGFTIDAQTGSGTGLTNGLPAQVSYAANQYTGGTGAATGYALNQGLFGMCAQSGGVQTGCPKFVPNPAIVNASANSLLLASGGGTTGTIPGSTIANTQGSVGAFNEATFLTGLVSGFTQAGLTNQLSQKTMHHAAIGGVGTNTDGDYIDQRLSQVTGGAQTLNQAVQAGGSSGTSVAITVASGTSQDPLWSLNVDPYGGVNYQNTGLINQAVADNNSGGFGDYGQLFSNVDVSIVNNISPAGVPLPATVYNATAAVFSGVAPASLP